MSIEQQYDESPPISLLGGESAILRTKEVVARLEETLPETLRGYNWKLLYSLEQHGANLGTFYARTQFDVQTLLVVQTSKGDVLGGFATAPWKPSKSEYYGTGESFLFSVSSRDEEDLTETFGGPDHLPVVRAIENFDEGERKIATTNGTVVAASSKLRQKGSSHSVAKYEWSGANVYFQCCTETSIAMGGGGAFGLYVEDDFSRGSTGQSETFSNDPLSSHPDFEVVNLECWGFTTAQTAAALARLDSAKMRKLRPVLAARSPGSS